MSHRRFVGIAPIDMVPLPMFSEFRMEMIEKTGFYAIGSTPLRVCENIRIPRHKVSEELAQRGKTSVGWFYGFELHLVINHPGELMAVRITAGNTDDRKPAGKMAKTLGGKLPGDKGHIRKELAEELFGHGLGFVTTIRKNTERNLSASDRILPRKRAITGTANDLLRNYFRAGHPRHRPTAGFMNNISGALIAYAFYPTEPEMRGADIQLPIITI